MKSETALLINPEIDKPEDHFYFHRNGKIKSTSTRGNTTISTCKLNREDLHIERRKLADNFIDEITTEVTDHLHGKVDLQNFERNIKNILAKIYKNAEPEKQYSRFGYFMFIRFEDFFIKKSKFDTNTKKVLLKIYKEFLTKVMA